MTAFLRGLSRGAPLRLTALSSHAPSLSTSSIARCFASSASTSASSSSRPPRLSGEVAAITGGSAGIGRETALLFAQEGAAGLVIVDVNEKAGQETVDMLKRQFNTKAVFVKADVSKAKDCENVRPAVHPPPLPRCCHSSSHSAHLFASQFVAVAEREFGKLSVLFNNAGIMHSDDDTAETTSERVWDLTFNVNVKGVFFGCKYGVPAIRRAGGGSIINTASFVALMGAATPQLAYTASKGAVLALSRELAVLHAKEGIRVNALCPGPLRTKLLMDFLNTEEKKQRRLVHVPMGRFGEAAEMAQAVLFLASKESSYVTGTDFLVDGGLTAAYVTPL